MYDTLIIHTDEINLKGGNRHYFEQALMRNLKAHLGGLDDFQVIQRKGSIILRSEADLMAERLDLLRQEMPRIFGVAHSFPAKRCDQDINRIKEAALDQMETVSGSRFYVAARRADKTFPLTSPEIARQVGAHILKSGGGRSVDIDDPEVTVRIEINREGAYVSVERIAGAGGLPTGTSGQVVSLLSGGIDSPVASWKIMRRGCRVSFVHFHSLPHTSPASVDKVKRLAAALDRYQRDSRLYLVPFAPIQRAITASTEPKLRVVLYRRSMLRLAGRLAEGWGAQALVTGDSIGQVASQTLENLVTTDAASPLPVFRPLIGEDKRDITALARRIGTYDISIEPHDDCCSLFVPDHPELSSTQGAAQAEEGRLDLESLVTEALSGAAEAAVGPAPAPAQESDR